MLANKLPQVSWLCPPAAYSEHPSYTPAYGAEYTSQILDALTSNPEVWSKTVLFIMYDENDGFFDHLVPPQPATTPAQGQSTVSTDGEIHNVVNPLRGGSYTADGSAVRPRPARADDDRVAVEQGRLCVLAGVRSHVGDSLHRNALWRIRAEHHGMAPRGVRRPDHSVRLPHAGLEGAAAAGHEQLQEHRRQPVRDAAQADGAGHAGRNRSAGKRHSFRACIAV